MEGWSRHAFVHRDVARSRRRARVSALVGPFDPIVWHRARAHRLFDFHYRIGIYARASANARLLRDAVPARRRARRSRDLKADRAERPSPVQAAWLEEGHDADVVVGPLAAELARMAAWLDLRRCRGRAEGTLAAALRGSVRA